MADELVGGRYRLVVRVGAGGMSEVWAADDVELGRRVALKLLSRGANPARFEREAQAVAALAHPNICRLYDYGEADGRPYMVLEYLGGGTLEDRLTPGEPYAPEESERIAGELAAGLAHAHARGLVHRDLKPANVLFDDEGEAKIADFGIDRLVGSQTLTETGTLLGTAAYISPEQAQGLPATAASDVYSFGVILYRLLSGRLPFESESPVELARRHIHEQPPPLRDVRPAAPLVLVALAEAAMEKDPDKRPPDGAALLEALSPTLSAPMVVAGLEAEPTRVMPPPPGSRGRRSVPLSLLIAGALLLGVGAAGLAVALLVGGSNDSTPAPATSTAASLTRPVSTPAATSTTRPTTSTTRPTTATSTRAATTALTTVSPPPPPPPPTPPPPTPPPPPTTLPTTVTIPVTTAPLPPPPPPPPQP